MPDANPTLIGLDLEEARENADKPVPGVAQGRALADAGAPNRIRIQVVLYRPSVPAILRLISSLGASKRYAEKHDALEEVTLLFGDSSMRPLGSADLRNVMSSCRAAGLTSADYRFFGANLGSAGGSNRLARDATEDAILVLNPDTYVSPPMVSHLARRMQGRVGITEARQIPLEHPKAYSASTGRTSWASGACMMIRTGVFRLVGGFDDANFFLHGDDVDISWRVRLADYEVVHVPEATVHHDKRLTIEAQVAAPEVERYHSALSRLMIARRYGRPDILDRTLTWLERSNDYLHREVLDEWYGRQRSGRIPDPVPGAERVAEFTDQGYAVHRF